MSLCSLLLSLETANDVQSVALYSQNIQATSKGCDQTVICGFAGRTYHTVGNLMSQLNYVAGINHLNFMVLTLYSVGFSGHFFP